MAKQASDASVRAVLVEMAWKWLDLAELDEWDNWEKAWRVHAIQTNIGRELRVHFDLPQEMPPPILARLMQIDAPQDRRVAQPRATDKAEAARPPLGVTLGRLGTQRLVFAFYQNDISLEGRSA
jgi:hypothetical protein